LGIPRVWAILVTRCAARLAIAVLLALAVRAAFGQQYGPQYVRQYSAPPASPPASGPVNQAMRYPLPSEPTMPMQAAAPAAEQGAAPIAESPPGDLFLRGQTVAIVGDKFILYGDIAPTVSLILAPLLAKVRSQAERDAIEANRGMLTRNVIQQTVQTKMLLLEFERSMPPEVRSDSAKRAEAQGKIDKQVREGFEAALNAAREKAATASREEIDKLLRQDPTVMRLAILMKERHLDSYGELDAALREFGTSLGQQARDFGEYMMGIEAARKHFKKHHEVSHEEMIDYYRQHEADYYIPAKAQFEILTVKFANYRGDRMAAERAIVEMGNAVYFGAEFAAVARKGSQEPRAAEGGFYDWVTPGGLASKPIDRAIFTLEVGKLSQIITDDTGYHILRVKQRQEAGQVSFQEAQPDIKAAIEQQKRSAEQQKYLTELRARTKVWTIYDPPAETAGAPASQLRR
jgi:parvulin-like peptidyl-prolyl isomerase